MEENENLKEINNSSLSNDERKEKLLLEFMYLKNEVEESIHDKKKQRKIKKIFAEVESSLNEFFQINIPKKNITKYINLKKTNFDPELLRLVKYIR